MQQYYTVRNVVGQRRGLDKINRLRAYDGRTPAVPTVNGSAVREETSRASCQVTDYPIAANYTPDLRGTGLIADLLRS